jgi:hypothetical protein
VPTTLVVASNSDELQHKFLPIEIPPDPILNFPIDPINTPLLTTSMLDITIVSTPMIVIPSLNNCVIPAPSRCL